MQKEHSKRLVKAIELHLKRQKMSRSEAASKAGVTRSYLQDAIKGRQTPSDGWLLEVAYNLGIVELRVPPKRKKTRK